MIKPISKLSTEVRILLLKAVANGEIDKSKLNANTLVCVSDYFLELMKAASPTVNNRAENKRIIYIGEGAKDSLDLINRASQATKKMKFGLSCIADRDEGA